MVGQIAERLLPVSIQIRDDTHAILAAQQGRALAARLGFSVVEQTACWTAILEVTRNIVKYAGEGCLTLRVVEDGDRMGIVVVACDDGPGIPDLDLALQDGYSTGKGLGLGLPGARRLMDSFEIASQPGQGTTIIMLKWCRAPAAPLIGMANYPSTTNR